MAIATKIQVIRGKDVKPFREVHCGCMIKSYPLRPDNDLADWLVVERKLEYEEKWSMESHKHKDFEEYWFVVKGKAKFIVGDEEVDVEEGDLVITPRGVCHKAIGDVSFICCTALHNVYGQTIGPGKLQYEACAEEYREKPEDVAKVVAFLASSEAEYMTGQAINVSGGMVMH